MRAVALVALLARVLVGERLTSMMVAGIGLIIAGVLLVEFGSQRAETAGS